MSNILYHSVEDYEKLIDEKLSDKQLRDNLKSAMDTLKEGRRSLIFNKFNDWHLLRDKASSIKQKCLSNLPNLIQEFENNCRKNGIVVHYASDANEANQIIYDIASKNNIQVILKGKSMASEEIHLNHYLKDKGVSAIETDLGEIIIQFIDEPPVHIVVPAIHKNRYQIGEIFQKYIEGAPLESDPEKLNEIARKFLREKFENFRLGLTGVNFAIADSGSMWLIENEGNGRMSSTACDIHVAICGIEKIVESFSDASVLNSMLATSAVGKPITCYNNIISGPRKSDELDGPKEVHVVLLDNNRTKMLASSDYYKALSCIRCGTCLNHCPVYDKIGGHSYMATYPGPIGEVISPQIFGLQNVGYITNLCSLCGRCAEVCPVEIPLDSLIRRLRADKVGEINNRVEGKDKVHHNYMEKFSMYMFGVLASSPVLWRTSLKMAGVFMPVVKSISHYLPVVKKWVKYRTFPELNGGLDQKMKDLKGVRYE